MGGSRSYSANPSDYKLLEEIGYGASATVYRAIFLPTNDIGLIEGISSVLNKRKEDEKSLTELTRTDIIKCIQSKRVKFRGVNLSSLDLSKLDLSFVDFSFACLKNVFSHVQIFSVQNFGMWMLWVRIFTMQLCASVNLPGQIFVGLYWLGRIFRVQIFKSADLTDANLKGANLEGANLKGAKLSNANLKGANLQRAYL